jgi:hypothetical protein
MIVDLLLWNGIAQSVPRLIVLATGNIRLWIALSDNWET